MPYVITTATENGHGRLSPDDVKSYAVATLAEAREYARSLMDGPGEAGHRAEELTMTHLNEYTVFAVYEDNHQPYATTVQCATPAEAMTLAQRQAGENNILMGMQVVAGSPKVVA